jgi:uncharacterized membrane protein YdbT with pleckstrin-like domain
MSSYIENSLIKDEKILSQANISMWSLFHLFLLGVILLPLFGFGLVFFLIAYIRFKSTELAITNKRVIAKFGFISRSTVEINLPKIESIQVHQGIFGRIFNYGSLVISGAGSPKAPIPGIAQPLEFRKSFNQILENTQGQ